jgi:hypothetical protein
MWALMVREGRMKSAREIDDDGAPAGGWVLIAAAIATIAAFVLGTAAVGTTPRAADTGEQVAAWFREHATGVRWSVWTSTVVGPLFALMFALLRRLLPAPHRDVFLIGGVVIIVSIAVQSWTAGGLALHAERLDPAVARTVLDVALFFGPVLTGAFITLIAPVTLLALGGHAGLPRWLGVLGAVAVLEQAIETVTIFGSTGFTEPGGAMNLQLGAGLVMLWLTAFAVWAGLRSRG